MGFVFGHCFVAGVLVPLARIGELVVYFNCVVAMSSELCYWLACSLCLWYFLTIRTNILNGLTNTCRMGFPFLINWTSPFPILGLVGGIFHFYSNFKRHF